MHSPSKEYEYVITCIVPYIFVPLSYSAQSFISIKGAISDQFHEKLYFTINLTETLYQVNLKDDDEVDDDDEGGDDDDNDDGGCDDDDDDDDDDYDYDGYDDEVDDEGGDDDDD
ncbi:hypothetical protein Bpfe_004175 [Biomphalaria pfeifferi]|uniref:Uncharacterized protein n=1 Tax=Biomphalaria pfeifferi TaxID=112525 RepID=A0AAD8C5T3_BIOPF|nr:hypothetical protein Bpfe_004175 [Biomphalaria pfeifferi]